MAITLPYSKGQIDRAGKTLLRSLLAREPLPSAAEQAEANVVLEAFREAHHGPMDSAMDELRSCIAIEELAVLELSQRLKRAPTIVDKLRRMPTMKLSSLQDLGGCRAVFATQEEVERVQARFMASSEARNGRPDTVRDYVTQPRDSGYRAVHLWTRYDGLRVEVQLRTQLQHAWGFNVEHLSVVTGTDYKSGAGSSDVHAWLRLLSRSNASVEAGVVPERQHRLELMEAEAVAMATIVRQAKGQEASDG